MKNVLISTEESLALWEDFQKDYVSLDEILDKYEIMQDVIKFLEREVEDLRNNDDS